MKKLNSTCKMIIGMIIGGGCIAGSYFAGRMVGEAIVEKFL